MDPASGDQLGGFVARKRHEVAEGLGSRAPLGERAVVGADVAQEEGTRAPSSRRLLMVVLGLGVGRARARERVRLGRRVGRRDALVRALGALRRKLPLPPLLHAVLKVGDDGLVVEARLRFPGIVRIICSRTRRHRFKGTFLV